MNNLCQINYFLRKVEEERKKKDFKTRINEPKIILFAQQKYKIKSDHFSMQHANQ